MDEVYFVGVLDISIHALREESDRSSSPLMSRMLLFQSTPSARRATSVPSSSLYLFLISIHALREESDPAYSGAGCWRLYFNPRPPRGERRPGDDALLKLLHISIHALREESDLPSAPVRAFALLISIHALREESDFSFSVCQ